MRPLKRIRRILGAAEVALGLDTKLAREWLAQLDAEKEAALKAGHRLR